MFSSQGLYESYQRLSYYLRRLEFPCVVSVNQTTCKEGDVSVSNGCTETLPLLGDLVLYYCRHADQPVLVQLYQAEVRGHTHTHENKHTHTHTLQ